MGVTRHIPQEERGEEGDPSCPCCLRWGNTRPSSRLKRGWGPSLFPFHTRTGSQKPTQPWQMSCGPTPKHPGPPRQDTSEERRRDRDIRHGGPYQGRQVGEAKRRTQQGLKVLGRFPLVSLSSFGSSSSGKVENRPPFSTESRGCGSTRANFWLRSVRPDLTEEFARHDSAVWRCLCTIFGTPTVPEEAQVLASFSFSSGGLGLADPRRMRHAAHFASWADTVEMVRKRHPHIDETMIAQLELGTTPTFEAAHERRDSVVAAGLDVPSWNELSLPSPVEELAELEPNQPKLGWQQKTARQTEQKFVTDHWWPRLDNSRRALMRSQRGHSQLFRRPGPRGLTRSLSDSCCAAVPLAPPLVSPHLLMWPPSRPVWPPSRSVFRGRGVGEERFSS